MNIDIYQKLLNTKRIRPSTYGPREVIVETESDRGRIIFSNAFRRLQQKAQVFPLESNAAVRTRLTHSLEVAHTGRYLAQQVLIRMRKEVEDFKNKWLGDNEQAFVNIVESACLIHDIGNPPFGHFGEAAIRDWFEKEKERFSKIIRKNGNVDKGQLTRYLSEEYTDFLAFDGNAQGLRVVTKLQGDDGETGLNLTYALIAAYLKYGSLPQETKQFDGSGRYKKPGYFNTEKHLIDIIWPNLGIKLEHRFSLSYIMEAADDIAYCLSDIEDGIEKGILSEDDFFDKIKLEWDDVAKELSKNKREFLKKLLESCKEENAVGNYTIFKTSLINHLVNYAAQIYCDKHDKVVAGELDGLIRKPSKEYAMLEAVRNFVGKTVFQSRKAEGVELAGYATIKGLLDHFSRLLECSMGDMKVLQSGEDKKIRERKLDYERRLYNRISAKSKKVYSVALGSRNINFLEEWHLRAHMIVDYLSGMTDDFSLETYQLLTGIKVEA